MNPCLPSCANVFGIRRFRLTWFHCSVVVVVTVDDHVFSVQDFAGLHVQQAHFRPFLSSGGPSLARQPLSGESITGLALASSLVVVLVVALGLAPALVLALVVVLTVVLVVLSLLLYFYLSPPWLSKLPAGPSTVLPNEPSTV